MLMYILFLVTFTVVTILGFLISVDIYIYRFVIYSKAFSSLNQLIQLETTKDSMYDIHLELKDQNGNSQMVVMFNFTSRVCSHPAVHYHCLSDFVIKLLSLWISLHFFFSNHQF